MPAKLIVFEGMNRSGKTTQAKKLLEFLKEQKFRVLYTKEPQATAIGAVAKSMICDEKFSSETIAIAFAADTRHHIDSVLKPSLGDYDFIILDRYYHSSYAYHPLMGCGVAWIKELHRHVLKPDITFILDIPITAFRERAPDKDDVFENVAFQERLKAAYLELPKMLSEDFVILDCTKSIDEVHSEIRKKVMFL